MKHDYDDRYRGGELPPWRTMSVKDVVITAAFSAGVLWVVAQIVAVLL